MAYRETNKAHLVYKKMREAKAIKRLDGDAPDYPMDLPDLRRTIIIIDHDLGEEHRIDLYKTNRIDCFKVIVNGEVWKNRIGFSAVLAGIRKSMPRIRVF